jgi:hypothetical protein
MVKCTWITPEKNHLKRLTQKTFRAIREIVSQGIRVIIVTADDGAINAKYAHKVGAELIQTRDKGNLPFRNIWNILGGL